MALAYTNTRQQTYYLHCSETTLKNGRTQTIYFFKKEIGAGALDSLPEGRIIAESKNGLPVLKKAE